MTQGSFIHIADIGAMIGDCGEVRNYLERRANRGKEFKPLPDLRDSLDCRLLTAPNDQIRRWAVTNGMNEISVNAMSPLLFAAALEHEDINEKLRDIFTRIALYMGPEVSGNKDFLQGIVDAANSTRYAQEKAQAKRVEESKKNSRDYINRIAEVENRLESRKQKFIRSLRKMMETYGTYDRLTPSDKAGIKFLHSVGWVEIVAEGVKIHEVEILASKANESFFILRQLKSHIDGTAV